jgi:NAD+ diphosphatase
MNQPWPFPSQLMIACHSHADDDTLTIDETELADARWYTREEVAEAIAKGEDSPTFIPPPPVAVAFHLMTWWLEKKA